MLGIIKKLKTSIKYRLIIEFGIILIAICIFNYFLQSYIYKEVLDKKIIDRLTYIIKNYK